MSDKVRIKKGVRPYGGRILTVAYRQGVAVVCIMPGKESDPNSDQFYRIYDQDEVEELNHGQT